MPDAWDTSVASQVHGSSRHASLLAAHRRGRVPIPIPAPTIQELVRGLALPSAQRERASERASWLGQLVADPIAEVVAFGGAAAQLSGWLLARLPHPPARNRRRKGSRAQQRAAWALDVQIAACAFAGGYGVLTENVDDFAVLRDAISELFPAVPPLVVTDARATAEATVAASDRA